MTWVVALSDARDPALVGGKAANLGVMIRELGLSVPPGFVISTEACRAFLAGGWPDGMDEEIRAGMGAIEASVGRRFGDPADPLLVSVRSGAPVSMPGMMDTILNLGLTPDMTDGFAAWRSRLEAMFRETVVHRFVQDAISAGYPGGPLVAARLLRSAGVLHVAPELFVMPDDPALGEYRKEFADLLGYVEEKPGDGFAGAKEVMDSDELLDSLSAGSNQQVDARAFLRARLMDQLMGDWDRHRDQWKWAAAKGAVGTVWRPIPRDRDQAFVRYDGLLLKAARQAHPKLVVFEPTYPKLLGLTWNGRDLDRRLLSGLSWADFDSIAGDLVVRVSDAAIDSALAELPASFRGDWLELTRTALIARRDALPAQAKAYYRQLARDVDEALSNPNIKSTTVYWPIEDRSSGFDTPIDEPPHYDPKVPDHWHVYIDWSKTKSDLPDAVREGWLTRTGTTI